MDNKLKWVPISFCQFVIENNAYRGAKLFCYLKYHSSGITKKGQLTNASNYFKVSNRTIRRWKNEALRYNWIGEHQNILFVRGWQFLITKHEFRKKSCFKFRKSDLKRFEVYCFAAVICYMARTQLKELERSKRSFPKGRMKYRSRQALSWVPMASNAIAKTLNVSETTARKYRNKAANVGFFKKRADLKIQSLNINDLILLKSINPEAARRYIINKGKVYKQNPDRVFIDKRYIHTPKRFEIKKTQ